MSNWIIDVYLRFVLEDWSGLAEATTREVEVLVQLLALACQRSGGGCRLQQSAWDQKDLFLGIKLSLDCSPLRVIQEFQRHLDDTIWNLLFNLEWFRWSGKFYVVSYGEPTAIPDPLTHPFHRPS